MSLITSQKKKNKSQKRKDPPDSIKGKDGSNDKKNKKTKKDDHKKKIPPLVEGQPFQRGHRVFGWHTNKFTNQKTLRPCEVILRRAIGSIPVLEEETVDSVNGSSSGGGGGGGHSSSSKDSKTNGSNEDINTTTDTNTNSVTYDYYVHFLELNRRNDCWLKGETLQIKDDDGNFAPKDTNVGANSAIQVSGRANVEFIEEAGHDKNEGMDEQSLREHEEITKVKNVEIIELGKHRMETWYFSPYPPEYFPNNQQQNPIDILYICEFTLNFFKYKEELRRHYDKNAIRHPPGNEIYRDEIHKVSMFEVDGGVQQLYCQNLCWLGKLFLDHKTLYYDVDPFMFYILTEFDERGYHIVGFYSKEKLSDMGYNLACILTLPA